MADDDEQEWRFSVDEVGPDDPDGETTARDDPDTAAGSAVGEESRPAGGDDDWVQMVGEDDDAPTVGVATEESDDSEGNVAGALVPDAAVEPGTPDLENVAFATAGAVLTALVFAGLVTPLEPVTVAAVTASIVAGASLLYVLFRRF